MKQFQLKALLSTAAIIVVLAACKKDKQVVIDTPVATTGVYVLNQGNFNANNSTLSYYDFATKSTNSDRFNAVNGTKLGDTGNDVKIYGSKMYIVVNVSSTVEVVDAKTTKSIKQIKMVNGTTARQPRYVIFNKNKAYISSYDGTIAVLDTATLAVEKYITVGRNPEQMVISNGKLYVANSGALDFGNPDKTVSVVDLNTLTEIKKINVAVNPITIAADDFGDVYVIAYGDYSSSPRLTIIDNRKDEVKTTTDINVSYGTPFLVNGDVAYYYTDANTLAVYNLKTETVNSASFITDNTTLKIPYAMAVNKSTGELFVADALSYTSNGVLYAFDKTGKVEYSFATGINPGAIALVNK